ncbi:MAG: hypothetical protein OXP66_17275 [Candidatus Tectomicrobia bacterium]|nr:hypothetical protein [Candidatus Tectomicrobia bacterium]
METETECFCRMKEAGFSEEFIGEVRDSWGLLRERDREFLVGLVELLKSGLISPKYLKKAFAGIMYQSRPHAWAA